MKMFLWLAAVIVLIAGIYYFFFQSYEFKANFSSKTQPGDIIETIRIWSRSKKDFEVVKVDSFSTLRQRIIHDGREYFYDWNFNFRDSVTKVSVEMSEPEHRFFNKLMVPFSTPQIEKDGAIIINEFYNLLKHHLVITNVKILGEEKHESEFCLCRTLEKNQIDKANGMMENFVSMSAFILESGLRSVGYPSVRVIEWSHSKGKLKYDFCFAISETDSLPVINGFEYKRFESYYGLKAEFHGNYITSDRAWYELYHYANISELKITGLPIEYFVDNPNFGNEKVWKAEIFLPVAKK